MVNQTMQLVKKSGMWCDTTKKILEFYRCDNISRACLGICDYVTHKNDGQVEKIQRRLILMNLSEAYELSKTECPDIEIGFSKFASLRPKECVLAGSTQGIHTTCVCVYHQNVNLIFDSLKSKFDLEAHNIETNRDMMEIILCKPITEKCWLNECENCPGLDGNELQNGLKSALFNIIDDEMYEKISFKQWINAGRKYNI